MTLTQTTARRFVLGRQGLWPGRRHVGLVGVAEAIRAGEAVQLDPLQVVARSHDITLQSRVRDYRPELLHHAAYRDRGFFDYGDCLYLYPMTELPCWRLPMRRRAQTPRWSSFAAAHPGLLDEVRAHIRDRGPTANRYFTDRKRVDSYRGRKDTALALCYLWLTGELMIHHRERFERVYDLRERVAPQEYDYVAAEETAEAFFARKIVAFRGLLTETEWKTGFADYIGRRVQGEEASRYLTRLTDEGVIARVSIEGSKKNPVCAFLRPADTGDA
ncbi:MAG: winged helix DNA-binding domain-containing protein [candidate division Zixibacteria bacterium]|nr:winged helix DNA-binding domain-containing protein [candidate division Zixibacteria bacterium]